MSSTKYIPFGLVFDIFTSTNSKQLSDYLNSHSFMQVINAEIELEKSPVNACTFG